MLRSSATKKGTGIELFGDGYDLESLHYTIHKIADNISIEITETKAQATILLNLAYEVRKAQEGFRLKENKQPGPDQNCTYLGFQMLWADIIFAMALLRYNAGYLVLNERDQANLYNLEYLIKSAAQEYDTVGYKELEKFLKGNIASWDPLLFLMLQAINFEYLTNKSSKSRFRKLPRLIEEYTSHYSETHKLWLKELHKSSKKQKCDIVDLEYDDYPDFEW